MTKTTPCGRLQHLEKGNQINKGNNAVLRSGGNACPGRQGRGRRGQVGGKPRGAAGVRVGRMGNKGRGWVTEGEDGKVLARGLAAVASRAAPL